MKLDLNFQFRNPTQEEYFRATNRNKCFSGGFGNGKTYVACQEAFLLLATFENYGYAIARHKYSNLRRTTMRTFFKICPWEFVHRHDEQTGLTVLKNKSFIYWLHLDEFNEEDSRGLEINSVLIDQAEEVAEGPKNVLSARVGRWDQAKVPNYLIEQSNGNWPKDKFGRYLVPNRFSVLCNPTEAGQLHWLYREYHPESSERRKGYFFVERETDENLNDAATIAETLSRDEEFVDTYYRGKWGKSRAQIHYVAKQSIISVEEFGIEEIKKLVATLKQRAALTRVLDHGETGVTCCTFWGAINRVHICYQEYYAQGETIPIHRRNINDYSVDVTEYDNVIRYSYSDFADPDIFKKHSQKEGAYTTVAQEYFDEELTDAEPFYWQPADNNEMATRDRINVLLTPSARYFHPLTKESPAPGVYFISYHADYPHGEKQLTRQIKAQRRTLLGSENGKNIYSDDRDESVIDHAYDTFRYYVATHMQGLVEIGRKPPERSFEHYRRIRAREKRFIGINIEA